MNFNDIINLVTNYIHVRPTVSRILFALLILIIGLLFRQIFVKRIVKLLLKLSNKTKNNFDDLLVTALEKPARVFIIGLSIWGALSIIGLPILIQTFINRLFRTFFIIVLFWFFYRAADCIAIVFERFINKSEKKAGPVLIGLFRKTIKIVVITFEIFAIIKEWGFDVSGLVAGIGVGGLAISLAAKDAVSNLLGSITIMSDKTYDIGDWIQSEKIEGIVEEIGFRSTKIRTFSNALTSVPNYIMSNEPVTNWSKMGKRRVNFNLNIPLDTPTNNINMLLRRIRELLANHEDVNQEMIAVNLSGFGEASLQIVIYYFTKTTSYLTYLGVTEDINIKIIKIFEEVGVKIIPPRRFAIDTKQTQISN